ncbi:MAG: DUF4147 domain-containing protein [Anaerolineae bacterium]|nr:DUF4147 domain-containing protein [Thermoflexales bacterium]MDW8395298.1 DUF4147 domain-containing protein [Anaerolineae bacterium]
MSALCAEVTDVLIRAALEAVAPTAAVRRCLVREGALLCVGDRRYALDSFDDLRLVAVGKAAPSMAVGAAQAVGQPFTRAVVVTQRGNLPCPLDLPAHAVAYIEAGHPVPDEDSLRAGEAICTALEGSLPRTLIIACISGGASALAVAPHAGISLRALRAVNTALLACGADIREVNAVRARLDRLKGGGFVALAQPAQVVGLILSDVVGDPLDVIASGLTYHPAAHNVLIGSNAQACAAAARAAQALGWSARVVTTALQGEAREVGAAIAAELLSTASGTCLIYGGETTVTVRGRGKGGRCQELALAAALALDEAGAGEDLCLVALATDGADGSTDVAGARVDSMTIRRAAELGLDARTCLADNDSYTFFARTGGHIRTGATGTNVADLVLALHF